MPRILCYLHKHHDRRRSCGSDDGSSFQGSSEIPSRWTGGSLILLHSRSHAAPAIVFDGPDLALEPVNCAHRSHCSAPPDSFVRPAIGAVVTLDRFLWGVAGPSPVRAMCARICFSRALTRRFETVRVFRHCPFMFVFLVKGKFINRSFGEIGRSLRGVAEQSAARVSQGSCWSPRWSIDCQLDGWWLMVQCLAIPHLLFKSLIPHFKS